MQATLTSFHQKRDMLARLIIVMQFPCAGTGAQDLIHVLLLHPQHPAAESTITTPVSMFPLEDTEAGRFDEVTEVIRAEPELKCRRPRSQPRLPPSTLGCTCITSRHFR